VTVALKLTHDEPRLVYLALVYHLGRPGSELDTATRQPVERGLRDVKLALGNELAAAAAVIELDEWQYGRLLSALKGCLTELRVYHMRGGGPSTITRWTETVESLYPAVRRDPEAALDVAEAMMMLQRRMERAVRRAVEEERASEKARKRRR
jgi:hypothetical protein